VGIGLRRDGRREIEVYGFSHETEDIIDTIFVYMKGPREEMKEQEFIESREEMEKILSEEELGYLGLCLEQNLSTDDPLLFLGLQSFKV
jgi:hypothetical protein